MTQTATPLAVLSDLTNCTGKAEHEARIITDGTTAAAYLTVCGEDVAVARDLTVLTAECPAIRNDQPCPGTLTWHLDTDGAWTTDPQALDTLARHGVKVER